MAEQRTHKRTSERYVGRAVTIEDGRAVVELETTDEMAVDEHDLVHGGFVFGAADYAAMLAVNEPTVVLVGAETSFTAPTAVGDTVRATATVDGAADGIVVECEVERLETGDRVMVGTFECAVPSDHLLA
ncbi:MAG: acyl-coenzyme A thioesterase PaaI-like protein [Halobacteriales archaeon]|jgi:acyl-coenzyme A thioesterase PaaI-like protein